MTADVDVAVLVPPGASAIRERPRRPWLAALLSLFGPAGQVYAGALRRAVVLWAIEATLFLAVMLLAVWLVSGPVAFLTLLAVLVGYRVFVIIDACRLAVRNRRTARKAYQRWWVYPLVIGAIAGLNWLIALAITSWVGAAFIVPTRGMADTILAGDKILVDKMCYQFKPVKRGDVVVFYSEGPGSPAFVQRAMALAGDEIEMRDEIVYVNGEALQEPYAKRQGPLPEYLPQLANFGRPRVPPGRVFVLGDNRRLSKDSRLIGCIPAGDVLGKVCFIYWSRERTVPDPFSGQKPTQGPIRWERIGMPVR
jgi:signal peptidase I